MFPVFKTQEEIPEQFRDNYVQEGENWVAKLPEDGGNGRANEDQGEDLDGLKATVATLRSELKEIRKARKDESDLRTQVENELRELKQKNQAAGAGVTDEKLKELRTQIRADVEEDYKGEVARLQARIEGLEGVEVRNRELLLDSRVKERMLAKGVLPDKVDKLFKLEAHQFDLTEDEKPKLTNHPGKTVDVFIDELKLGYPEWFKGTQASGGGAGGHHHRTGGSAGGATVQEIMENPVNALTAARGAGKP